MQVTLLDTKTSLNVNIFLKQFKTDNASIVTMIRDGDSSKMSIDQLKALEKLLPDSSMVSSVVITRCIVVQSHSIVTCTRVD